MRNRASLSSRSGRMQPTRSVGWSASIVRAGEAIAIHGDGTHGERFSKRYRVETSCHKSPHVPSSNCQITTDNCLPVAIICWRGCSFMGLPVAAHGPSSRRWVPSLSVSPQLSCLGPRRCRGQGPQDSRCGRSRRTSELVGIGQWRGRGIGRGGRNHNKLAGRMITAKKEGC